MGEEEERGFRLRVIHRLDKICTGVINYARLLFKEVSYLPFLDTPH